MLNQKVKRNIFLFLVFFVFLFLLYHFKIFWISPEVKIYGFEDSDRIVVETDKYFLSGVAPNSKNFYLNGRELTLDQDYNFAETLYLFDYQNTYHIKSVSKAGPIWEKDIIIFKK